MKMGGEESNETGRRKYNPSQVSAGIGRIRSMPAIAAVVLAFEACIGALLLGRSNLRFNFLVDNASRGTMMREGRHTAVDRDPAPHDNGKLHSIPRSLQELDERIVGGIPVDDGEYPFFVISAGMMLCGGTLIHPEYVCCYGVQFAKSAITLASPIANSFSLACFAALSSQQPIAVVYFPLEYLLVVHSSARSEVRELGSLSNYPTLTTDLLTQMTTI